jgi:hypothetical protein
LVYELFRLDAIIKTKASKILNNLSINPGGSELDTNRIGRNNFVVVKSKIDKKVNDLIGRNSRQRQEFSQTEIDKIQENIESIINQIENEIRNATS